MAARRGNTLIEIVVASGVFVVILVTVILIYRSGTAALEKTGAQSDPFRMAAIAQDHIKSELRGATLLCPRAPISAETKARIILYQPEFTEPDHLPRFLPGDPPTLRVNTAQPTIIEVADNLKGTSKELIRRGGGRPQRKLADLGPLGTLLVRYDDETFGRKVVSVRVVAGLDKLQDATRSGQHVIDVDFALTDTEEVSQELLDDLGEGGPPTEPPEPPPEGP